MGRVKNPYFRDGLQHAEVDADESVEVLVRKAEALHVEVHLSLTAQVRNLLGQTFSAQDHRIVVQEGRKGVGQGCQRDRSYAKNGSPQATEQTSTLNI